MMHSPDHNLPRWLLILSLVALASTVTGCSGRSEEVAFERYLDRLGRTLEARFTPPPLQAKLPRPPRTGQLRVHAVGQSIAALDFLDLGGCQLQVTVGKRNSSLGLMATDSQHLLLELEYLRLAPACVAQLRKDGEADFAEQLEAVWRTKQQQLAGHIFNATVANREYREFWRSGKVSEDYPTMRTGMAVVDALETITTLSEQWLDGNYDVDPDRFEQLLADIASGDGGTLWLAMNIQSEWLAQANTLVDQRLSRGPLCSPNRRFDAADILPNVIHKFFIEGIQPRATALGRRYHQLLPPVQRLEQLLAEVLPPDYQHWRNQRDNGFSVFVAAPKNHVGQLQLILEDCQPQFRTTRN